LACSILCRFPAIALLVSSIGLSNGAGEPAEQLAQRSIASKESHRIESSDYDWYDASHLVIEGRGFKDTVTPYSRLPRRYQSKTTGGVWYNGQNSTGVTVRFVTDSTQIHAAWESPKSPMPHMAWSGSGGVDLYALYDGKWEFVGMGRPENTTRSLAQCRRFPGPKEAVEYMLFLPSYSKTKTVQIGIDADSKIAPAEDRYKDQDPIVFYGTSITQGGCASRSGMGHVEILRRQLDYPTVNLGFSGSGKCEMPMADLLAEIPASIYVIETLQNMNVKELQERMVPFTKALRAKRPKTPIVFAESPNVKTQAEKHVELRKAFDQLKADGLQNLYYLPGAKMFSIEEDGTVDGTHPTDLGFYHMALEYKSFLRNVMKEAGLKPGRE